MMEDVKIMMMKGEAGNSIVSITKTGETTQNDIYTITLTDGSTVTLTMQKGTGIASIEKTGTVGLVDTYTITLTNGNTETFTVTNGQSYTVPEDGIIYFDGTTIPEGYEETAPPAGQAVEIDDTEPSPSKVYSSAKVESLVEYSQGFSSAERVIGTWIDDFTPVYERTFSGTFGSSATSLAIPFDSSEGKIILDFVGVLIPVNDNATSLPFNMIGTNNYTLTDSLKIQYGNNLGILDANGVTVIRKQTNFYGSTPSVHITIKYLKTAELPTNLYANGTLDSSVTLTGFVNDTTNNVLTFNHPQSAGTSGSRTNYFTFTDLTNISKVKIVGTVKAYTSDGQTEGTTGAEYVNMSLKLGWGTIDGESIPLVIDDTEHAFEREFDVSEVAGGASIFFDTIDNSDSQTTAVNAILEVNVSAILAR